jgi:hypothetical protein
MGDYGIKVTNPGTSIASTAPEDYCLHSKYYGVIIGSEVFGTVTCGTGVTYATATHNFGYIPVTLLYTKHLDDKWYFGNYWAVDTQNFAVTSAVVGTSNLVIGYENNLGTSKTVNYKVYFLGEING